MQRIEEARFNPHSQRFQPVNIFPLDTTKFVLIKPVLLDEFETDDFDSDAWDFTVTMKGYKGVNAIIVLNAARAWKGIELGPRVPLKEWPWSCYTCT